MAQRSTQSVFTFQTVEQKQVFSISPINCKISITPYLDDIVIKGSQMPLDKPILKNGLGFSISKEDKDHIIKLALSCSEFLLDSHVIDKDPDELRSRKWPSDTLELTEKMREVIKHINSVEKAQLHFYKKGTKIGQSLPQLSYTVGAEIKGINYRFSIKFKPTHHGSEYLLIVTVLPNQKTTRLLY